MKRILFVEDNEMLLQLYGLMLEGESDAWQPTLAPDGATALRLLHETAFDVVVSDMQMPGMNGIELLEQVRNLHPETSRIIISGFVDQREAANSLGSTHLFIPKPFDLKTLHDALARISRLDAYLKDDRLRALAGKMRSLPSFPTLYLDIMREIESPTSSIQGIANIVDQDPAITAKILQVANSAAVGLPQKIGDPAEAVQQLGVSAVRAVALSAHVYGNFAARGPVGFSADALWQHLMDCGRLAREIMQLEHAEPADAEDAFTAGLLHDMGKLMLADSLPAEFGRALKLAAEKEIPLPEAELEVFGATHAGLAAYLLGLWGLPAAMVEAVAFHHTPEQSDFQKFSPLTAVHVANALCDKTATAPVNEDYLAAIGVDHRLDAWNKAAAVAGE